MTYCVVKGCHNASHNKIKHKKVTFHTFPSNPIAAARWITQIRLNRKEECWKPTKYTTICSEHFDDKEKYTTKGGYSKLRQNAVPTKGLHICCKDESQNSNDDIYDPHNLDTTQLATSANKANENEITNEPQTSYEPLLPGAPGPSVDKRARLASGDTQTTAPNEDCLDGQHAATVPTVEQIQIPAYRDTRQAHASHECDVRKELPIHLDIRCNVCLNDIVGFRYTCVQCVDWDMCASCEARGEHPEHYVLRLPAPKPKVESDTVLEAIRKYIDDLLELNNEMHEIVFKEEPVEVKEEMDLDVEVHDLSPELDDCTVPELTINRETSIRNVPAIVHAEVKEEIDTDVEEPHLTPEFDNRDVPEVRTHRESSIRCVPATSHAEETTRHTSSPDDSDEQDEVAEAVRSLTGKTAPNDRHLVIYKTLERNKNKIETDVKESAE